MSDYGQEFYLFSVYDVCSEVYFDPFVVSSPKEAVRLFVQHLNTPESALYKFPKDFELRMIGTFDKLRGHICSFAACRKTLPEDVVACALLTSDDQIVVDATKRLANEFLRPNRLHGESNAT